MTLHTNLENLVTGYAVQYEELELVFFDLLEKTLAIADAEGAQLDAIGTIVGRARHGLSDGDYRISLNAKILINKAEGTREELIEILDTINSSTSTITINETFPAHIEVILDDAVTDTIGIRSSRAVQDVKPACVRGITVWHTDATPFGFFGTPGALGFSTGGLATASDS